MSRILNHFAGMKRSKRDKMHSKAGEGKQGRFVNESVDAALKNYVILSQIFDLLPPPYLKSCREVNKIWSEVASGTLKKRGSFHTLWTFTPASNTYTLWSTRQRDFSLDLEEFTRKVSSNFPSTDFRFIHGNLSTPQAQGFFDAKGVGISSIVLDIFATENAKDGEYTPLGAFQNLLLNQLENLVSLNLQNLPAIWLLKDCDFIPDPEVKLEKLRVIELSPRCSSHDRLVQRLVEISVNLETFIGFHPAFAPSFDTEKKRRTIKTFRIHPTTEFLDQFEQMSLIPIVQRLTVDFAQITFENQDFERAMNCLRKVLECNKSTLRSARGFYPLKLFSTMSFPEVESVEEAFLDGADTAPQNVSIPGYADNLWLQKTFPGLTTVELGFWLLSEHVHDFFGSLEPLQSVKTLKFAATGSVFNLSCIPKISYLFPNVVNLCVGGSSKYTEVMKHIWSNFTLLESCRIELLLNASHYNSCGASLGEWFYHNNYYAGLDSVITGVSEHDLRVMHLTTRRSRSREIARTTSASILNMRHLKRLEIVIKGIPSIPIPRLSLFSYLSLKHGFEKMPTLDFYIRIPHGNYRTDLMDALEPVKKVAKIIY